MVETAKITLYNVKRCGYYTGRGTQPLFGDLTQVLPALQRWVEGKQLAATKTYEPAEDSPLLPAYLMGMDSFRGSYLLTLWNQVPDTDGQMPSVSADSQVGHAEVHMNEIEPGSIPGFASYFWIDPQAGTVASVKFHHLLGGVHQFNHYLQGYMRSSSPWCVYEDPAGDEDLRLVGYRAAAADDPQDLFPRFQATMVTKRGPRQELLDNVSNITKVHRKTVLKLNRPEPVAVFQRLLRLAGLSGVPAHRDQVKLAYEMPVQLTRDELEEIIDSHDAEDFTSDWEDVGLQLRGEANVKWLNRAIARDDFDLDVERDNAEVVNGPSLARELWRNRAAISGLATPL